MACHMDLKWLASGPNPSRHGHWRYTELTSATTSNLGPKQPKDDDVEQVHQEPNQEI